MIWKTLNSHFTSLVTSLVLGGEGRGGEGGLLRTLAEWPYSDMKKSHPVRWHIPKYSPPLGLSIVT